MRTEGKPEEAREYQQQVTGAPPGWVYRVRTGPGPNDKVDFDGFENGRLQEAKGPGYQALFKKIGDKRFFEGINEMIAQAQRQIRAAGDPLIEWHFAEADVAERMRKVFKANNLEQIRIVPTPPARRGAVK